jgi:restriction system protein
MLRGGIATCLTTGSSLPSKQDAELFDKVWQFDLANNLISIGWSELGDISKMSREALSEAVAKAYPDRAKGLISNVLWAFYHEISPGDFVLAQRGRKILVAVGKVVRAAFYDLGRNPNLKPPGYTHQNFIEVEWQENPRDKVFQNIVFPMQTLTKISGDQYRKLVVPEGSSPDTSEAPPEATDRNEFVLEKYYEKAEGTDKDDEADGPAGQQYSTEIGTIDILAIEPDSKSFVVIELKKGRPSDQVVGQVLRYMGWFKRNLCKDAQGVKGLVICRDADPKLSYALEMTNNIDVRYYSVSFNLRGPNAGTGT